MKHNNFNKQGNVSTDVNRRIAAVEQYIRQKPSRFPIGAPADGDAIVDKGLTKTAHGFDVGTIVFWDSDLEAYRLAKADDAETCVYDGVVSNVPDANTFDLTYSGVVKGVDVSTYDDGTTYYLSEITAGNSRDTPPAYTFYQVPVYHAFLDDDGVTLNLLVYPGRPLGSSHLAIVAGDASSGGGTGRIFTKATEWWDLSVVSTVTQSKITDGTASATITKNSLALTNGTITSTLTYDTLVLGSAVEPILSIDIYPSTQVHLNLNSVGVLTLADTSNNIATIKTTLISSEQTVSTVKTVSTLTPTTLTVGATPASPTAHADLSVTGLSVTASSAVTCKFTATLMTMTLSATNSLSLNASDITDTSQTVQFRKISICDPTTGTVKNTWMPCSAPF